MEVSTVRSIRQRWVERKRRRRIVEDLLAQADQERPGRLDAQQREFWDAERLERLGRLVEEGDWGDDDTR